MGIANYADENTPYATVNDIDSLIVSLQEDSESLLTHFDNNLMKSNADICHLSVIFNGKVKNKIDSQEIPNTKREKLLRVHLDSELSLIIICKRFAKRPVAKFMLSPV